MYTVKISSSNIETLNSQKNRMMLLWTKCHGITTGTRLNLTEHAGRRGYETQLLLKPYDIILGLVKYAYKLITIQFS